MDNNLDQAAMETMIEEWIPKALKKYLGQDG